MHMTNRSGSLHLTWAAHGRTDHDSGLMSTLRPRAVDDGLRSVFTLMAWPYVHIRHQSVASRFRTSKSESMGAWHIHVSPLIYQEGLMDLPLAPEGNYSPLSLLVSLLLNLGAEGDRTHDSVAELLILYGVSTSIFVLVLLKLLPDQRRNLTRTALYAYP